jgi:rRNA maturation endonuclease Nob1
MNSRVRYCYVCISCGKVFYSSICLKSYCPDCGGIVIRCDVDDCYVDKNIIISGLI